MSFGRLRVAIGSRFRKKFLVAVEQRCDELVGVERDQITDLLTEPDELDRMAISVSIANTMVSMAEVLVELPSSCSAVPARAGVGRICQHNSCDHVMGHEPEVQ